MTPNKKPKALTKRQRQILQQTTIEHVTARLLSRDFGLPLELTEALVRVGRWVDNGDDTISFTSNK